MKIFFGLACSWNAYVTYASLVTVSLHYYQASYNKIPQKLNKLLENKSKALQTNTYRNTMWIWYT